MDALARRVQYLDRIRHLDGFFETERAIKRFRAELPAVRARRPMPL